jgi:hypothetical protein
MDAELIKVYENVLRSYKDYIIALRLADPAVRIPYDNITIDKTIFVNATKVIRDALLHRAALAITRIYDDHGKDRRGLEHLIRLVKADTIYKNSYPDIERKFLEIKSTDDFKNLKDIRNDRLAHILENDGHDCIYTSLHRVYSETQLMMEMIDKTLSLESTDTSFYTIWQKTGLQFWKCVFTEGGKYIPPISAMANSQT